LVIWQIKLPPLPAACEPAAIRWNRRNSPLRKQWALICEKLRFHSTLRKVLAAGYWTFLAVLVGITTYLYFSLPY